MNDPVQAQLEAYNASDLDAFVECYAEGIVVSDGVGTVLMAGLDSLRSAYGAMFAANADVHADVVARQHAGAWTVDLERVRTGEGVQEVLVAYRVEAGLIQRVIMLR